MCQSASRPLAQGRPKAFTCGFHVASEVLVHGRKALHEAPPRISLEALRAQWPAQLGHRFGRWAPATSDRREEGFELSKIRRRPVGHHEDPGAHIYNLGTDETVVVDDSVRIITEHLSLSPAIEHTGGQRGWTGDSPLIHLDTTRVRELGWRPTLTIPEALVRTLEWLQANDYAWRDEATDSVAPREGP